MKFSAKLDGLLNGLNPIIAVSETGVKQEYPDGLKMSLTVSKDGIIAEAHNGNVAARNIIASQLDLNYQFFVDGKVTVITKNLSNVLQSFSSGDILSFELRGGELEIRPVSDTEKLQTVPTESREIEMPTLATKFAKTVSISKGVLVQAISKVIWAIGTEKMQPQFFYWVLRFREDSVRAVAGDGGRFSIYEITGTEIASKGNIDLIFYKDQNPALVKALGMSDVEKVEINEFVRNAKETIADQIILLLDTLTLILVGHDSGVSWPNEEKFVVRKNPYKFITDVESWKKDEFSGIVATISKEITNANEVHLTKLTFDSKKKVLGLKVDGVMKAIRKIPILDSKIDSGLPDTIDITVETANLRDMVKYADGTFQMEMVDEKKPIVVRYFADQAVQDSPLQRVNAAADTKEQHLLFFATFDKP